MNEMQLQRVYDELYDVGDRLARLNSFLDEGGAEAAGVTGKARDLLVEQRFIMRAYYDVLNRRIDEEKKARAKALPDSPTSIRGKRLSFPIPLQKGSSQSATEASTETHRGA